MGLLDLSTGKEQAWIDDPAASIRLVRAGAVSSGWFLVTVQENPAPRAPNADTWCLGSNRRLHDPNGLRCRSPILTGILRRGTARPDGSTFYTFRGSQLTAVRFDARKRTFGALQEINVPAGSLKGPEPGDSISIRRKGLVFNREEGSASSVWLMKLPQ